MLQTYKLGQTSIVLRVKLLDSSATTGAGLTGLLFSSTGLIISTIADNEATATAYTAAGSTIETITTLGTYAAPTATKCRFKEVDATNHKGVYEIQLADARFAVSNAKSLLVSISGATNLAQSDFVVQLQSDDPYVAKPANSNLLSIDASGRVDVAKIAGTGQTARDIGASVILAGVTHTGAVIPTVTTLTNLPAITAGWLTAAGIAAGALNGKGDWNIGKTGYSLTQAFPANFADLSISVTTGLVNITQAAADKIWDTAIASHLTAGSTGAALNGASAPTAATVASAVWDAVLASHLTAGSTGYALNAAGSAGDPWGTALPGAYGAGSAGYIMGNNLNAKVGDVKTKTDFLPLATAGAAGGVFIAGTNAATTVNITGNLSGSVGSVTTVSDKTGYSLSSAGVQAIWDALTSALTTVGSVGKRIADFLTGDAFARLGAPAGASTAADIAAVKSDTAAALTRLPAALVGGRMDSNLSAINNSTTHLTAFDRAVAGNVIGTVGAGSTTTSIVTSSVTPAPSVADQLKGRLIIFSDTTTTAALRGQATDITASSLSATPALTCTALTTVPVSGDTFIIV